MKKKFLEGYNKVYIADADTVQTGFQAGVFAARDLQKGEQIFHVRGKRIYMLIKTKKDSEKYANALGIKRNMWIDPFKTNPLRFLNHSCEPNAGIQGMVTIVARKPIKKDTHITIDYSTTECDELWELDRECCCGAQRCRKNIKSIQSLPKKTYEKYLPYIGKEMQKEYSKAHSI